MDRERVPPFTLETDRLILVPLDASRVDELAEIYADPEVAAYIGGDRLSPEGTRVQVNAFEKIWRDRGYGQSAVIERASGRMLGRVGLHYWPAWDEVELGYVLARGAQGRGIAREASQVWLGGRRAAGRLPDSGDPPGQCRQHRARHAARVHQIAGRCEPEWYDGACLPS